MTENVKQVESGVEAIDQKLIGIGGWLVLPAIANNGVGPRELIGMKRTIASFSL